MGDVEAGAGEIFKVVEIIRETASADGEQGKPADNDKANAEPAVAKDGNETTAGRSTIDDLKNESLEFFSDSTNWIKLGAMFVGLVVVLVIIFVAIGVFLNLGGEG